MQSNRQCPRHGAMVLRFQSLAILVAVSGLLSFSGCQHPTTATTSPSPIPSQVINPPIAAENTSQSDASLIVPGKNIGNITAQTTLADLQQQFGKANVQAGQVPGPEGTTLPGAIVYPHSPMQKMTIYWKASKPGASANTLKVESVVLDEPHSPWHTEEGVKIGSTLKELEALNGQPFTLSGFDWDYGGMLLSWGNEGKLRGKYQGNLSLQFGVPAQYTANHTQVSGEGTFSSSNLELQKMNPEVVSITVFLQ